MKGTQKLLAIVAILLLGLGVLPLLAQPLPYAGTDWLDYEATLYYGDSYEPDDTFDSANQYPLGIAYQVHNFHLPQDRDWVWFDATAGSLYTVQTHASALGSSADTVVYLYDSLGRLLDSDNDGGEGFDSAIYARATYSGRYYVQVQDWRHGYGASYWYHLSVREFDQFYLPLVRR